MIPLTVCLLSCGRPDLTARTAISFKKWNPDRAARLLHIEVAATNSENLFAASAGGFETILSTSERPGQMETLRLFSGHIAGGWVLWLENDWESVAPLPNEDFLERAFLDRFDTIRLYGERKMVEDGPRALAGTSRMGSKAPIRWKPSQFPEWESGFAHWAAGGSILTSAWFRRAATFDRLKNFMIADDDLSTLRPKSNIVNHIGLETTPGFKD